MKTNSFRTCVPTLGIDTALSTHPPIGRTIRQLSCRHQYKWYMTYVAKQMR